jgi:hypothetical protein
MAIELQVQMEIKKNGSFAQNLLLKRNDEVGFLLLISSLLSLITNFDSANMFIGLGLMRFYRCNFTFCLELKKQ